MKHPRPKGPLLEVIESIPRVRSRTGAGSQSRVGRARSLGVYGVGVSPATVGMMGAVTAGRATRRHDLDWLRSVAVLLLIPFHAARIFDVWEPFYVKDAQLSMGLSYLIALIVPWHMPLLFLIAGSATWFALGSRSPAEYLGERFRRLFIPFVFGTLVVVPPQAYLARLREPGYSAGGYFRDFRDLTGYFGSFTPGHLWFIFFLFVIACAVLPLAVACKGEAARGRLARLGE